MKAIQTDKARGFGSWVTVTAKHPASGELIRLPYLIRSPRALSPIEAEREALRADFGMHPLLAEHQETHRYQRRTTN